MTVSTPAYFCARINLTPLITYLFLPTIDDLQGSRLHLCSHTSRVDRAPPALRPVASTWTLCGERLAPRRAHERYTAEPAACARLVCQAYHRRPGRATGRPPVPRLAHSRCPQSRATPPLTSTMRWRPRPCVVRPKSLTPTPTPVRQQNIAPFHVGPPASRACRRFFMR
jgi:hypothetical protein